MYGVDEPRGAVLCRAWSVLQHHPSVHTQYVREMTSFDEVCQPSVAHPLRVYYTNTEGRDYVDVDTSSRAERAVFTAVLQTLHAPERSTMQLKLRDAFWRGLQVDAYDYKVDPLTAEQEAHTKRQYDEVDFDDPYLMRLISLPSQWNKERRREYIAVRDGRGIWIEGEPPGNQMNAPEYTFLEFETQLERSLAQHAIELETAVACALGGDRELVHHLFFAVVAWATDWAHRFGARYQPRLVYYGVGNKNEHT